MVAYEEQRVPEGRDENPAGLGAEWYMDVRNLDTGKFNPPNLDWHTTNTETQLYGVGNVVSMVLKIDGSVTWIAEGFRALRRKSLYFDLGAVDKSGNHLLASGMAIDPSSQSVGGIRGSYTPETGRHVVYWIENGQSRSAELNGRTFSSKMLDSLNGMMMRTVAVTCLVGSMLALVPTPVSHTAKLEIMR
jgi:hypothetical protein